jgi:parvulin-like peptidyl-prolyl isomerase
MMKLVATRVFILFLIFMAAFAVAKTPTVLIVNGQLVTSEELERTKAQGEIYSTLEKFKGIIKTDLNNLLVNQLILVAAAREDAKKSEPSEDQVNQYIIDLRKQRNIKTDADYTAFLQSFGYTQVEFREAVIQQLALTNRIEEIRHSEDVSDEELKLYFELYKNNYAIPASIQARQIVVATLKEAQQILKRIKAGENFAALARSKSLLGNKQDGAIAAKPGETTPQPITELELPKALADAAFRLQKAGVTDIIAFENRFYIIKVEKFVAERIPNFQEASAKLAPDGKTNKLHEDAQTIKSNGAIENWVRGLQHNAIVTIPEGSNLQYYDPVVARVEGTDILLSELNRAVYSDQKVAQFSQLSADISAFLRSTLKPQALDNLVDQSVALEIARKLDLPVIGARADVLEAVIRYKTQKITVSEAEAQIYYQNNSSFFTIPASANLMVATFRTRAEAEAFRDAIKKNPKETLTQLIAKFKGTLNNKGIAKKSNFTDKALKNEIFDSKLSSSKYGAYTSTFWNGSSFSVYFVSDLKPERQPTFTEVKLPATSKALDEKRQQVGKEFLLEARKDLEIENNLDAVSQESEELGNRKP